VAELQDRFQQLRGRWGTLPATTRLLSIVGVVMSLAIGAVGYTYATSPNMTVLFSGLAADDAAQVVQRLGALNIPYQLENGGSTIRVPGDQVHETRLNLTAEGVPRGGGVGFEIFDEQRFGESEFSQQVNYHRALEGELARTIQQVAGVDRARVHLVMPERTVFTTSAAAASASVALTLSPGWNMREDQTRGIVNLVAASVRSLDPGNVTVVDHQGRSLSAAINGEDSPTDTLQFRGEVQRTHERAAQEVLDRFLGAGHAFVRVSADVNFAREEVLEERYDEDSSATLSFQITEEGNRQVEGQVEGMPGAAANLEGGEPAQVIGQREGVSRRTETRNFEPSKTVRRSVEPVGRVRRLSVAVVLDTNWAADEAGDMVSTPRAAEQMQQIEQIVARAVGLDTTRGDQIQVEQFEFFSSRNPLELEPVYDPDDILAPYKPIFPYVGYALLALLAFIFYRRGTRLIGRMRIRDAEQRAASERSTAALGVPGLATSTTDKLLTADVQGNEVRLMAAELAAQDPDRAARVIQSWLAEDANA